MPTLSGCTTTSSRHALPDQASRLPVATKTILDNGLTVVVTAHPGSGVVSVYAAVGVGSASEVPYLGSGISHFVEHMVFKGTAQRPLNAIEREVAALGGDSNGHTTLDETAYVITVPREGGRQAVELLADMLFRATFDPSETEKEQEVIRNEMRRGRDDPRRQLHELLWGAAFRVHPYRFPTIGYETVFDRLTREDLVAFSRRYYTPDNMVLSIAGDVEASEAVEWARAAFGGIPRGLPQVAAPPLEPEPMGERQAFQPHAGMLARVAVGYQSVSLTDPDLYALDLLSVVMGQGESALLVQDLQYRRRLVHAISAASITPRWPGLWTVVFAAEPQRVPEVIAALDGAVAAVQRERLPEVAVERAKQQLISEYLFGSETDEGLASRAADGAMSVGDPNFAETYLREIRRLTAEDLRRVAVRYLRRERRTVATVGPGPEGEAAASASASESSSAVPVDRIVLPNGAVLLTRTDAQLPLVSIRAVLKGGLWAEEGWPNGVAALMARLLTRGTLRHTASEVAGRIESLGGRLEAFSGNNSFGVSLDLPADHAEEGLSLLHEVLTEPAWDPDEMEGERARLIAAIRAAEDDVFQVAQRHMRRALYPHHPYGAIPLGTVESVQEIRHNDLVRFAAEWLRPGQLVVSMSGALPPVAIERAEECFGGWRPAGAWSAATGPSPAAAATSQEVAVASERAQAQAVVMIGLPGMAYSDPDRAALDLLVALFSGMDGRLFDRVRQQFGLAYVVGASAMLGYETGFVSVYAATSPTDASRVAALIREELQRCVREPMPAEELQRIKRRVIGLHRMNLQSNGARAMQAALDELYGLGASYMERYPSLVEQVSAEDVQRVAARCLRLDQAVTVVLSPAPPTVSVAE